MIAKTAALFRRHAWTLARAGAFCALLIPIAALWLTSLPTSEGVAQGPGVAVLIGAALAAVALSLAVDRLLARRSGISGGALKVTVAQTAAVWALPIVIAVVVSNPALLGLVITTSYTPAAAVLFIAMFAGIMYLGPAQALELWGLSATVLVLWMFPTAFGFAETIAASGSTVAADLMTALYLPLALGSTAGIALYLRRIADGRNVRGMLSRVLLAVGAVCIAVLVSALSIWWISASLVPAMNSKPSPSPVAAVVASDLMAKFSIGELTTQTPVVTQALTGYVETAGVGFTIVDWKARTVIVAVRRTQKPESPSGYSYGPVTLRESEAASILDWAVAKYDPASSTFGRSGQEFESAEFRPETGSPLVLVVTQPDADWTLYGSPTSVGGQTSQAVDAVLPWLLPFLLIPVSLTLLALERADRSRAELLFAQERARLSRDAHDRIYNRMAALASRLETAPAGDGGESPSSEIRGAVVDLQRILGDVDVRMAASRDRGVSLFDDVAADQAQRYGMDVRLTGQEALAGIDARLAWELQCAVEEALTNAGRHGHAKKVTVAISAPEGALRIVVADDGSGIAVPMGADGLPDNAHGLRGMRERMAAVGGTLEVGGSGPGVSITVSVPATPAV